MQRKRGKVKKAAKKHFSLREEYMKCYSFLKNSRNYIYFVILLFLIFVSLGFFFEDLINMIFRILFGIELHQQILGYLENLLMQTEGMSFKEIAGFIFLNNLQSSFIGMSGGIFFGILPFIFTVINGYILGFVAMLTVKEQGFFILWRILPHGIFELPAVFISLALGLRIGSYFFTKQKESSFGGLLLNSLRVFLLVVFPLLVVAAIIEGFLIVLSS